VKQTAARIGSTVEFYAQEGGSKGYCFRAGRMRLWRERPAAIFYATIIYSKTGRLARTLSRPSLA
jgi:hypothetical protein